MTPRPIPDGKTFTFTLERSLHKDSTAAAAAGDRSLASWIREAMRSELERAERKTEHKAAA